MINKALLVYCVARAGIEHQKAAAAAAEISLSAWQKKIAGDSDFTTTEFKRLGALLRLSDEEVLNIFYREPAVTMKK